MDNNRVFEWGGCRKTILILSILTMEDTEIICNTHDYVAYMGTIVG